MFKIVDRYIGRNVINMVLLCTLGLVALSSLIKFVDQLRNVGRGEFDTLEAIIFVGYTIPGQFVMFFPLGVLLGTVLALGNLASSSELIVMQSLGKSRLGIVGSACKSIIPLIMVVMLISEFVAPIAEMKSESVFTSAVYNGQLAVTNSGIWFKEGNEFINVSYVLSDGSLDTINRYTFTDSIPRKLLKIESAKKGSWDGKQWVMKNIQERTFTESKISVVNFDSKVWHILLSPDKLDAVGLSATDLSIRGLFSYISYMKDNGQNVDRYILELYRKLISPFMIIVVLLLAASTIFGPLRSASMGARIVVGIVVGFAFYAINDILAPFTIFYGVPPLVGALMPSIIVLIIAIYLLKRKT